MQSGIKKYPNTEASLFGRYKKKTCIWNSQKKVFIYITKIRVFLQIS